MNKIEKLHSKIDIVRENKTWFQEFVWIGRQKEKK